MQKWKLRQTKTAEINSDYQATEFIQRKSLSQLIYKKIEDVFTISKDQFAQVLKTYHKLAELV